MNKEKLALLTWIVLLAGLLISFFHRFAFGVVASDIGGALNLTGAAVSNLGAVYFYVYGFMQIPSGLLIDKIGPRRISALGMAGAGFGSLLFSFANNYFLAFSGRLLVGLGVSVIFLSILKVQSTWFPPRDFPRLTGITSAVGNLGAVLASAPFAIVVIALGWRSTFLVLALISWLIALGIYLLSRFPRPDSGSGKDTETAKSVWEGFLGVVKNPKTWPNFLTISGLMGSSMSLAGVWGVTYLMQVQDWSQDRASSYILLVLLGLLVGSPVYGTLGSRWGKVKPIINFGGGVATFIWILIVFFPGLPGWLWPFLYFGVGFFSIVFFLCFTNVTQVNPQRFSGIATSVINFGSFSFGAIITLIIGYMLDKRWEGELVEGFRLYPLSAYQEAFSIFIIFALVGFVASFFIVEKKEDIS